MPSEENEFAPMHTRARARLAAAIGCRVRQSRRVRFVAGPRAKAAETRIVSFIAVDTRDR
jgi:hypothetical protein